MCGKGAATGVPRGGPKGEEDTLAFFVGFFSSLFKKKNNNNLLPSHLHRFSASWDRRRHPGGKAKPLGKGMGVGLLWAGKSHPEAAEFQVPSASGTSSEQHGCFPCPGKILFSQGAPGCPHPGLP